MSTNSVASKHARQSPALSLHGIWIVTQYELVLTKTLTRTLERRFLRQKERFDSTNTLLDNGALEIRVELKDDGTYTYKQTAQQRVEYYERGTWKLKDSSIIAHSSTHNERSALDGSKIVQQSAESLVVLLSIYKPKDGLLEKIYYRRKHQEANHP